jgi:serine/threonine protein kinase
MGGQSAEPGGLAEICSEFEDAWRNGRPRIEQILEQMQPFERPALLSHLIGIEVRHRLRLGETPRPDEYVTRFPDDSETVVGLDWTSLAPQAPVVTSATSPRRQVGRFELIERVGAGGFGEVWRAFDPHLQREVAVKLGLYDSEDDRPDLMLHEARSAGRLRHPAIVPVHESDVEGDVAYIVSDYIPGPALDGKLKAGPLPPGEAAKLTLALAEALGHAHAEGVIHRDIKPSNVLLDSSGGPHLTDFGVARRVAGDKTISEAGQPLGTPAYMAPEQARGDSVDPRGDVYSLGLVLYEMLAGRRAYPGTASEALRDVLLGPPPPLRSIRPDLPRALLKIVEVATAREPADRYQTAESFAADLGRFLRGEPARGPSIGPSRRIKRLLRRRSGTAILVAAVALPVMIPVGTKLGLFTFDTGIENAQVARPSGVDPHRATQAEGNAAESQPDEAEPVAPAAKQDDGTQLVEIRTEPRASRLWLFPRDPLTGWVLPERRIDVPDATKPFVTLDRGSEYLIVADCGEGWFTEVDRRVPTRREMEAGIHEVIDCFSWHQSAGSSIRFELTVPPPPAPGSLVLVPGGEFVVEDGSSVRVIVPPFYLAVEELTVERFLSIETEWRKRHGMRGPARLPEGVPPDLDRDAPVPLSVAEAVGIFAKCGCRLPDELEWECATLLTVNPSPETAELPIRGLRSRLAELTGSRTNPFPWQVDPAVRGQLESLARNENLFDAGNLRRQLYVVRGGSPGAPTDAAAGQEADVRARHSVSVLARHAGLGGRAARSLKPRRNREDFIQFAPSEPGATLTARNGGG